MAEPQKKSVTSRVWIVLAVVIWTYVIVMTVTSDDDGGTTSPVRSQRAVCEQKWEDNRSTAEGPNMNESVYVANCLETARDLEDGTLDGR